MCTACYIYWCMYLKLVDSPSRAGQNCTKNFVIVQLSRYFGTIEEIKCFKAPSSASDKALAYTFPVYSLHNTRSI